MPTSKHSRAETKTYTVRGFVVRREQDLFVGVLLKPYLVVQAKTAAQAEKRLHALLHAYVEDAIKDHRLDEAMARRARPALYVEYGVGVAIHKLAPSFKPVSDTVPVPCLA